MTSLVSTSSSPDSSCHYMAFQTMWCATRSTLHLHTMDTLLSLTEPSLLTVQSMQRKLVLTVSINSILPSYSLVSIGRLLCHSSLHHFSPASEASTTLPWPQCMKAWPGLHQQIHCLCSSTWSIQQTALGRKTLQHVSPEGQCNPSFSNFLELPSCPGLGSCCGNDGTLNKYPGEIWEISFELIFWPSLLLFCS